MTEDEVLRGADARRGVESRLPACRVAEDGARRLAEGYTSLGDSSFGVWGKPLQQCG